MIGNLLKIAIKSFWQEGKDFDRQQLQEPAALVELLPWRLFDEERKLFINDKSVGVIFEFVPLAGNISEEQEKKLSKLLSSGLENNMTVQLYRFEHPHSGFWIDRMLALGKQSTNNTVNKIYQNRYKHLQHSNEKSLFPDSAFYMRDVRCFVALSMECKGKDDFLATAYKVEQSSLSFRENFTNLSGSVQHLPPGEFLALMDQWLHPDFSLQRGAKRHDPLTPLHHQLYSGNHSTDIFPGGILTEDMVTNVLTIQDIPDKWSSFLTPMLNGEDTNKYSRSICPSLIVTNLTALDHRKTKIRANMKVLDLGKKSKDKVVKLVEPSVTKQYEDWKYVHKCVNEGEKLVNVAQYVIAFSSKEQVEASIASIVSMYADKGWGLTSEKYGHFPAFLYCLPFMPSEGMYQDFHDMGRLKTRLTSTCASLTNFYGDFKGFCSEIGVVLQGRHGQPFFFNPFVSHSNFNVAIVGVPGAGKSVLMQELVTFVLSCGGEVIVIDDGYSFKNSSILLKGEHIIVKGDISINPFSMIDSKVAAKDSDYLDDSLLLVEGMLERMVRPRRGVDESETARLNFAVREVWKRKGVDATITDVAKMLLDYPNEAVGLDPVAAELNKLLKPFCREGSMGKYFNKPHTIDIRSAYTVYEMSVLDKNKTLQSLVIMMIIFMVSEKMYHGDRSIPKAIVIDEAWNLLSGKGTAKFIEGIARRARKYKAALITGTQDLNDYSKGAANSVWNSSNWRILMNQSSSSIDNATSGEEKLLTLSPFAVREAKSIATSKGQYSELFIVQAKDNWGIVGRLALDPYSATIYSSDASDVSLIQQIQEEQNISLGDAIDIFVSRKGQGKENSHAKE